MVPSVESSSVGMDGSCQWEQKQAKPCCPPPKNSHPQHLFATKLLWWGHNADTSRLACGLAALVLLKPSLPHAGGSGQVQRNTFIGSSTAAPQASCPPRPAKPRTRLLPRQVPAPAAPLRVF